MTSGSFHRLIAVDDVPDGEKKPVEVEGKHLLVCHLKGEFYAIDRYCSHAKEVLDCGRMAKGWIACPVHGARFDLKTGAAKNPPAKQPIGVYPVRVMDGWVEAEF